MESNFRNYYFSDACLVNECSRVITCVNRDINDFANHKITPSFLANLSALTLHLSDLPTEEELQDGITAAKENKDGIRELIQRKISAVRKLAEDLWDVNGKYRAFGFEDMNLLEDNDVLLMVKRVVRVSNRYLTELQANGLTGDMLTELKELAQQFLDAIRLLRAAADEKESQLKERAGLGNHLYDILTMLTNIGKSLHKTTNEEKYNDYILQSEKNTPATLSQSA